MKPSKSAAMVFLTVGMAFVLAGLFPRLRGGEFNSSLFAPGIAFILIGGAIRRRRQREEEREGPTDGR